VKLITTVVNKHHGLSYDIFIGRGSKWANPFVIGRDGDRLTVVEKYEEHLDSSPHLLRALHELRGKVLGCFCHPKLCHGHILAERVNALPEILSDIA
jgi:hypothetical protein